jgi:osomolarity two-component system phosphorelay intermediate protein YPD1
VPRLGGGEVVSSETKLSIDERLERLYNLGHYLRGSSASLGLVKVSRTFSKLKNHANRRDAEGDFGEKGASFDPAESLARCVELWPKLLREEREAMKWLMKLCRFRQPLPSFPGS